jgi:cystathionine gamma-synthase
LLRITDVSLVAKCAHAAGSLVVVDNTFLSPALQQPIALGADIVVHSTTKYLNGHSDVVGGAVIAAERSLADELAWWANCLGITGAPFDSYLTLRGVRTLHSRIRDHLEGASAVVDALCNHPAVSHVYYPGLATHPGHEIARAQQSGFGAMVSFEIVGGTPSVELPRVSPAMLHLAESLGGVESLIAHPGDDDSRVDGRRGARGRGNYRLPHTACRWASNRRRFVRDLTAALDAVVAISGLARRTSTVTNP